MCSSYAPPGVCGYISISRSRLHRGVANQVTSRSKTAIAPSVAVGIPACVVARMFVRKAAKALEDESGHQAEPDARVSALLSCVSAGRWEEALSHLSSVQVSRVITDASYRRYPVQCELEKHEFGMTQVLRIFMFRGR